MAASLLIAVWDIDPMSEITIHYNEWAKQRPELAKLGTALWDAETEEDVKQACDNIQYDI